MHRSDAVALHQVINNVVAEKIFLRAKEPYSLSAIEQFLKFTESPANIMLVAEYDQQLVAWLDIIRAKDGVNRGVLGMGVAKAFRHQQVGKQLMQSALSKACGLLSEIRLQVYYHNEPAVHLYQQFGFVEVERQSSIITMSKAIPASYYPK